MPIEYFEDIVAKLCQRPKYYIGRATQVFTSQPLHVCINLLQCVGVDSYADLANESSRLLSGHHDLLLKGRWMRPPALSFFKVGCRWKSSYNFGNLHIYCWRRIRRAK